MGAQDQQENDPLLGTVFADRYHLQSRLGKGGMAVVYKAIDKNLGRDVALKVLRKDIAGDPIAAKRLMREARAAAALHHPHIITIHDVGEKDGTVYVVMEVLIGQPLSDVMEEVGGLGIERSLNIAEQLASALVVAHGQNIIHRDIKPENLFLLSAGGGDFVKVLDFSIAKLPTEMVTAQLTRAGSVFGTPHYMAPEQVEGKGVGPQTDLYALGAVMYEMVAGEPPYDGPSVIDILLKHVKSPPPSLAKLGLKLPTGMSDLVIRLLAKKQVDRPANASVVREEIARMLAEVRHEKDDVAQPHGGSTAADLGADVYQGLAAAGVVPTRGDSATFREDQPPIIPIKTFLPPAVPEANTVAVDTAAITAGVVAARARAISQGMSPVAAMTIEVKEEVPLDLPGGGPDDLPDGPPTDLPSGPAPDKRKFPDFGSNDHNEQRTMVGVGLGQMVAEIAKRTAALAPAVPPVLHPPVAPAAPALPAAPPAPPPVVAQPPPTAPPKTRQEAAPSGGHAAGIQAPGAVARPPTDAHRAPPPQQAKPPPPPPSTAAHTRRPPARMPHTHVDDRAPTQPGLGMEPVPQAVTQPPAAQTVETQLARPSRVSGSHPMPPPPVKSVWTSPPVLVAFAFAATVAVGVSIWLLLRG